MNANERQLLTDALTLLNRAVRFRYDQLDSYDVAARIDTALAEPPAVGADTNELLEAVADIAYLAGGAKYYGGDSREDIQRFIRWAREFEAKYRGTNWGQAPDFIDYIETIDTFTETKLNHPYK